MKNYIQFLSLLILLSGCVIADKVHWRQTDAAVSSRFKNNPTAPNIFINFAKCEEELIIFPFFFIWDNKKYDYALDLTISTGSEEFQTLDSVRYEILDDKGSALAKGNLDLNERFKKWGDGKFLGCSINAKTDYYVKADNIKGDLTLNLILYLTNNNGKNVSFSYPNEKLRRNKLKKFQSFIG